MRLLIGKTGKTLGLTLACSLVAASAFAGVITNWNTNKVTTDPGPYVEFESYRSTVYTDAAKTTSNGFVGWTESDVLAPGLKIVNGDDVDGTNCIMVSGFDPADGSDKQCSDDLKSSKRFKLKGDVNAPTDLEFDVVAGETTAYKVMQKYSDYTLVPWDEFTIELGFLMADGTFVKSSAGDGIGFSDSRARVYSNAITSYQSKPDVLSALYAQGLAGAPDKYHPEPGYFDPAVRMSYGLIATEDQIVSDGISTNYTDLFGPWNNIDAVPWGYYWDDDADPNTDNTLMANCSGDFDIVNEVCNGVWETYRSCEGLDAEGLPCTAVGVPTPITQGTLDAWDTDMLYAPGAIEDLTNLGLTYYITVGDPSAWPTPGTFTIRFTPVPVSGSVDTEICTDGIDNDSDGLADCDDSDCADDASCQPVASEVCDDGIDNDADGYADCADPDCSGVGSCGPEGKFDTCSDGLDNDGDGYVDCDDAGCSKNKSCR